MAFEIFFQDLLHGLVQNPRQFNCGYHDFILAQDLLDDPEAEPENINTKDKNDNDAQLKRLISGNIVLIGSNIKWLSDKFDTPYGRQPGVAVHAMALDNLITKGINFQRVPAPGIGAADVADLFSFAMMFIAILIMVLIQDNIGPYDQSIDEANSRYAIYVCVIAVTTVVTICVGNSIMHWPPIDLLEIIITLGLALLILEILTSRQINRQYRRSKS